MKHIRDIDCDNATPVVEALSQDRMDQLEWISRWQRDRDPAALDSLLRAHASVIRSMARAWTPQAHQWDDLISEGNLALICCIDGYAPREGVPFFAYARPFVRAAMRREVFKSAAVVDIPLQHRRAAREGRLGDRDLATLRGAAQPHRMDDSDIWDLCAPEEPAELAMIRTEETQARKRLIDAALSRLSNTERLLVERCRTESRLPLAAVAASVGTSVDRIRKMEARAFARMKAQFIRIGVTSARVGDEP